MMSSVAPPACFQVVFMAYCFASSREKTMMRFGRPSPPCRRRLVSVWPSEPVPPVMRTTAPSSVGVMDLLVVLPDHLVPRRNLDPGGLAEAGAVQGAVDARLVDGTDLAAQPQRVARAEQEVVLRDRRRGHVVEAQQLGVLEHHFLDHARQRLRRQ